ncbi:DUF3293 domain-containing protein [Limnohabitans sp.]|uniref:DUF3293 domain-containing protein n=1 Tax=Limnohabitans sp. TaxID=1907725 RepID=UPI00391C0FB4
MPENLPIELVQAFTGTDYIVHHEPSFTMNIGKPCEELKKLMANRNALGAAFITAWNPFSQKLSAKQNEVRQQELKEILKKRGLTFFEGIGQHPSNNWPGEASVLVLDLNREAAKVLARHFEQHAFVWAGTTAVPELIQP